MDTKVINPFLLATMHVLKTMAGIEAKPGKPFIVSDRRIPGDVSAIMGVSGAAQGAISLSFTVGCLTAVASSLFGEVFTEVNEEVKDSAGELANMICGDARRRLAEQGLVLKGGIPTVVTGSNHTIKHIADGPHLAIPFETAGGSFMVVVAFNK